MTVGIICEYNPFHNGHLFHLNKVKELYKDSTIILVTNACFSERGDINIIDKWDKTELALSLGIDLVVELPFVFSSQSADIFSRGAIEILNNLKVDKIVFGSECNNIELLKQVANSLLNENNIKEYLKDGNSYPKAISNYIYDKYNFELKTPNDILGVCYIKEIIKSNSNIEPVCIERKNDYHSLELENICSASAIRNALKEKRDVSKYVPNDKCFKVHFLDELFPLIKYKIIIDDNLKRYQTVNEGIEYRLKKYINDSYSLDEFINNIKTKRYTYNRIKRMLVHILCGFTKEEAANLKTEYIRVLGFSKKGRYYLKEIKKETEVPIITGYKKCKNMDIEIRCAAIYSLLEPYYLKSEFQKPIKKIN